MKQLAGLALGIIAAGTITTSHPAIGIAVWIGIAAFAATLYKMRERSKETKRLNRRIEDIHILTKNPETGETPIIERHKGNYIVAEHHKVFEEVDRWREKLRESENPLYTGIDAEGNTVPTRLRIDVKPIIFRHGGDCNEFWTEYLQRAEDQISEDRSRQHKRYAEKAEEFYREARYNHDDQHLRRAK